MLYCHVSMGVPIALYDTYKLAQFFQGVKEKLQNAPVKDPYKLLFYFIEIEITVVYFKNGIPIIVVMSFGDNRRRI